MMGGGWRIIGWFYRKTEGVSRHQRIIKGRGGGLQKIDCQLTANEWGGGGREGGEHENITEQDGGLGRFFFFVSQPKSSDPALFSPGDR